MSQKITRVSELKAGDKIRILKNPHIWSDRLCTNYPLNQTFPLELTIKAIKRIEGVSYDYHAMTCGSFGWSLEEIIAAGCELITPKISNLPKKWYIQGHPELITLMKELNSNLTGNSISAGYYSSDDGKSWAYEYLSNLGGYTKITVTEFKQYLDTQKINQSTNNQTTEAIMQPNETSKQERITAMITENNQIVVQKDDRITLNVNLIKETITTRVVKLQSVSFDKKDKAKETPIVTTVEREVSVSVIADENGHIYTGYVVKNPTDKKVSPELGKEIARNRAVNPKTNLTPHEVLTIGIISKQVLKGIAETFFERMSKGSVKLKGVK